MQTSNQNVALAFCKSLAGLRNSQFAENGVRHLFYPGSRMYNYSLSVEVSAPLCGDITSAAAFYSGTGLAKG
jgi:hypothetical protein